MRLTQANLNELLQICSDLTGEKFIDREFNGFHHIMFRQGEMIIAGTLRECYDYMQAFKFGLRFKEIYN